MHDRRIVSLDTAEASSREMTVRRKQLNPIEKSFHLSTATILPCTSDTVRIFIN